MNQKENNDWIEYSGNPSLKSLMIKRFIKLARNFLIKEDFTKSRDLWDKFAKKEKLPSTITIQSTMIGNVACEWILPKEKMGQKTIIYLHGGGYVLGSLFTARSFGSNLSEQTGERVLNVGYRLAPENPFPAALEDSLSVYRTLLEEGVKSTDIILVGDSAGGGLSLATVLALRDNKDPLPGGLVCISPWTDLAATGESNKVNIKLDPIFGSGSGGIKAEYYAGNESLYNPLISPLYGNYENFPPLLIHVGTDEIILDDSLRLAEKARHSGVKVSLKVWRGMWHVFTLQYNMIAEAKQSLEEIADFIKSI